MRSNVCELVKERYIQNDFGVLEPSKCTRTVFCDITSVSASEWFEGGRNGLNPEKRVKMFRFDYHGEKIVEIDRITYTVYRTYEDGDEIELYLERRKGNE